MGSVETLSIYAIDLPHAPGQVGIRGLNEQIVMIPEQAKSGNPHMLKIHRFFQKVNKGRIVIFSRKRTSALLPLFITWYHAPGNWILNGLDIRSDYHLQTHESRADLTLFWKTRIFTYIV